MPNTVHVLPHNDLIEHVDQGTDCPCGPRAEPVFDDDGACGWVITHHSLDGREHNEPDHNHNRCGCQKPPGP